MWTAAGCAVQGLGHSQKEIPCQDKVYQIKNDRGCCAALADGAGSASLSHIGADCVVTALSGYLLTHFDELYHNSDGAEVKKSIIEYILKELEEKKKQLQCEIHDLASTCLAVAIQDDRFILVHLGDGIIGYFSDGEVRVASYPYNGDYVNETVFTTTMNSYAVMDIKKGTTDRVEGFVMMSDGASAGLYERKSRQLIQPLLRMGTQLACESEETGQERIQRFLERQLRRLTSDDCSLMFVLDQGSLAVLSHDHKALASILGLQLTNEREARRCDFYYELLSFIQLPKTGKQIERKFHIDSAVVRKRMKRLLDDKLAVRRNGKFVRKYKRDSE